MSRELKFKKIVAQYCDYTPEQMEKSFRFREDLGFSSLDFMSLLGELEDEFDVELEEDNILSIHTIGEALSLIEEVA
jgi:acyl carrier protein